MTKRLTAEQIADKVRENLTGMGGRQGFLSDPGGWLDHVLADQGEADDEDHEIARQAIDLIVADHENADVPQTAEQMVEELRIEWGITDAWISPHADDAVFVPVPGGSLYLEFGAGDGFEHVIGRKVDDGSADDRIVWSDPQGRSISGALGKLAELAEQAEQAGNTTDAITAS